MHAAQWSALTALGTVGGSCGQISVMAHNFCEFVIIICSYSTICYMNHYMLYMSHYMLYEPLPAHAPPSASSRPFLFGSSFFVSLNDSPFER